MRRARVFLAVLLAACGGFLTEGTEVAKDVRGIRLDARAVTVLEGEAVRLMVTLLDATGTPMAAPKGRQVTWASTAPDLFSVDSTGVVTGLRPGEGSAVATYGALSVAARVTVQQGGVPRLVVADGDAQTAVTGSTLPTPIRVMARSANGAPATNVLVSFTPAEGSGSTAPSEGLTDASGSVTTEWTLGDSVGGQVLLVTAEGFEPVTVTATATQEPPAEVARIVVVPNDTTLAALEATVQLTARAYSRLDGEIPGVEFTWTTSDSSVATVGADGVVTAIGNGTAVITASAGTASGSATVHVKIPSKNPTLVLTPSAFALSAPQGTNPDVQYRVAITNANGPTDELGTITWGEPVYRSGEPTGWLVLRGGASRDTIAFTLSAGTLAVGTYHATIPVSATEAVNGPQAVAITLTITRVDPPVIRLSSSAVEFRGTASSDDPAAEYIEITNAGGGTLDGLAADVKYTSDAATGWLKLELSGRVAPAKLMLAPSSTGLPPGSHTALVIVTAEGASNSPQEVMVTLTISEREGAVKFDLVATGEAHTCALSIYGVPYCWGNNEHGQLGDGTRQSRFTPHSTLVDTLRFMEIQAGGTATCAITGEQLLHCWGRLGSSGATRLTPTRVLDAPASTFAVGADHACALTTLGQLYCWGGNEFGQIGDGTTRSSDVPVPIGKPNDFESVSVGGHHTCATRRVDGGRYVEARCWGRNDHGQLGDGTFENRSSPPPEPIARLFYGTVTLALGATHTCVSERPEGEVQCWGGNTSGQLGDGTRESRATPAPLDSYYSFTGAAITAGSWHTCALRQDRSDLFCWGDSYYGQTGTAWHGPDAIVLRPTQEEMGHRFRGASAGGQHTCAITNDYDWDPNALYCWGNGASGQLGIGDVGDRPIRDTAERVALQPRTP